MPGSSQIHRPHAGCSRVLLGVLIGCLAGCGANPSDTSRSTQLIVSAHSPTMALGQSITLRLLLRAADGSVTDQTQSASWTSKNTDVATVTSPGTLQAHGLGTSVVTASVQELTTSFSLTVTSAAGVSVTITPNTDSVAVGATRQMKATENFTDGSTQDVTGAATWTSSQPDLAAVSSAGVVTGKSVGSATVTAQVGEIEATSQIAIAAAALTSITVTASQAQTPLGLSQQFKAVGAYTDGSTHDVTTSATWSSSQTDVAAVDNGGMVTAKSLGTATVNAAIGSISGSNQLTVTAPVLASLAASSARSSLPLGSTVQFNAIGTYTDGSTHDLTTSATWASSQPDIAPVSAAGLVTAKALGSATVNAQIGSIVAGSPVMVGPAALASLSVNTNRSSVPIGLTQQFTALGTYTDGATHDLTAVATWTSSQPDVAIVGAGGIVTTKALGSATVSAAVGSITATGPLTVTPATLVSLAINNSRSSIPLGLTQQLTAIGTYSDGSTHDLTATATWTSSQPGVATISSAGLVTATAVGSAGINAQVGTVTAATQITVAPAALVTLSINTSRSSIPLGSSQQFTAVGAYTDGTTHDLTGTATWTSSQPGVASMGAGGLVTAMSLGSATVSAVVGPITATRSLTVTSATLATLAINSSRSSIPLGLTQQLTAIGTYSDGSTRDLTATATWTSSQPGVATISSGGLVTAKAPGSAGVNAQSGTMAAATQITVTPAALVSLAVNPNASVIPLGLSQQFSVSGTYSDGSTSDVSGSVTWSSTPSGIVSISASGKAQGTGLGSATIQAQSGSISGNASLQVAAAVIQAITVSPSQPVMPLGTSQQLAAQGQFSDGSTQDVTNSVTWSSDAPNILAVSASGKATSQAVGSASISAVSASGVSSLAGPVSNAIQISVSAPALSSLSIQPDSPAVPIGSTLQLTAIGTLTDGSTQDKTSAVTWTVDNTDIAQMTDQGIAAPVKVGSTNVEATLDGITATAPLVVQPVALTSYFTNDANRPDTTVRISNPGIEGGMLCTMVYVFDQDQQMTECCGCAVSPDGLRTVSVQKDLGANPLTGVRSTTGSIMLVPAEYHSSTCDAGSMTPGGYATAWSTHLQSSSSTAYVTSETPFSNTTLSDTLSNALQAQCQFIQQLGSGQGICQCGAEK